MSESEDTTKPNILFVNLLPYTYGHIEQVLKGSFLHRAALAMPMGSLYLSSYLKAHNDVGKIELLDFPRQFDKLTSYSSIDEFAKEETMRYADSKPDIIAISLLFSASHPFFDLVLKISKEIWPKALTVVGGLHATNCPKYLLKYESIDYVVLGEGEIALSKMVKQYASNEQISVRGVYDKSNIKMSQPLLLADGAEDLDILPLPDWELIDMEAYAKGGFRNNVAGFVAKSATIITTRGCPLKCTFCSAHTVHGRKVRYRSAEKVLEEIKLLNKRYGISIFTPADDFFTANKQSTLKILRGMKHLDIPDIEMQFTNGVNINSMDEEILDSMIDVGVRIITLALESGSEYVQKNIIKKNVNLRKAKELVLLCRRKGITTLCNVIFGFAGETKELMEETADYIRTLGSDWYAIIIAAPLIGTELYEQFLEKGYIKEDVYMWSSTNYFERTFDTNDISAVQLNEYTYRLNLDVNFINNINLRNGNYDRAITLFRNIVEAYPFHVFGLYCIHLAYKRKGNAKEANDALVKIREVLKNDIRSKTMYEKYKDLLPENLVEDKAASARQPAVRIVGATAKNKKIPTSNPSFKNLFT